MPGYDEEFHLTLGKFHQKYGNFDRASFLELFSCPFLIFDLKGEMKPPKSLQTYAETTQSSVATATGKNVNDVSLGTYVAPIQKSLRNSVKDTIFVGRKPWSDIVIPHVSISKMHAFFKKNQNGAYIICDTSSRKGTQVRGKKVTPKAYVELHSKDIIVFADAITSRFLDTGDFFDYMDLYARMKSGSPGAAS